jgi:SAM-dependent methyltransferase
LNNLVFGNYARYYNLFYLDKDYAAEACYIHELIRKYCPGARTVLNLGCGTGNHDFELAKYGYEITGVDMSEEMLSTANARRASNNSTIQSPCFQKGDIRTVRLDKTFDVVVSLFHVMSYQTTNGDLQAAVATAKEHLAPSGFFIFDCWYGPAVLSDPPVVRVKRLEDEAIKVVRIAEPVMHPNENVVDVNYQVMITEKSTGTVEQLVETHRMRYLFLPELELFLRDAGLSIIAVSEMMTGNCPDLTTWGVCFVVKG